MSPALHQLNYPDCRCKSHKNLCRKLDVRNETAVTKFCLLMSFLCEKCKDMQIHDQELYLWESGFKQLAQNVQYTRQLKHLVWNILKHQNENKNPFLLPTLSTLLHLHWHFVDIVTHFVDFAETSCLKHLETSEWKKKILCCYPLCRHPNQNPNK